MPETDWAMGIDPTEINFFCTKYATLSAGRVTRELKGVGVRGGR